MVELLVKFCGLLVELPEAFNGSHECSFLEEFWLEDGRVLVVDGDIEGVGIWEGEGGDFEGLSEVVL